MRTYAQSTGFIGLAAFIISTQIFAGNPIFRYEPKMTEITGTLDTQTFPGPPNYESIATGDEVECHWYVKLDFPIDVIASNEDKIDVSETERNVKILQLAPRGDDALMQRLKKTKNGTRIKLKGSLFHRFTGHHHARILLSVDRMEVL